MLRALTRLRKNLFWHSSAKPWLSQKKDENLDEAITYDFRFVQKYVRSTQRMFLTTQQDRDYSAIIQLWKDYDASNHQHKIRLLRRLKTVKEELPPDIHELVGRVLNDLLPDANLLSIQQLSVAISASLVYNLKQRRRNRNIQNVLNDSLFRLLQSNERFKLVELMDLYQRWVHRGTIDNACMILIEEKLRFVRCFADYYDINNKVEIECMSYNNNIDTFLRWISSTKFAMLGLAPELQKYLLECPHLYSISKIEGKQDQNSAGSQADGVYLLMTVEPRIWWLLSSIQNHLRQFNDLLVTSATCRKVVNDLRNLNYLIRNNFNPKLKDIYFQLSQELVRKWFEKQQRSGTGYMTCQFHNVARLPIPVQSFDYSRIIKVLKFNDWYTSNNFQALINSTISKSNTSFVRYCQLSYYASSSYKFQQCWQDSLRLSCTNFWNECLENWLITPIFNRLTQRYFEIMHGGRAYGEHVLRIITSFSRKLSDIEKCKDLIKRTPVQLSDLSVQNKSPKMGFEIMWVYVHHIHQDLTHMYKFIRIHLYLRYFRVRQQDIMFIEKIQSYKHKQQTFLQYARKCLWMRRLGFTFQGDEFLQVLRENFQELLKLPALYLLNTIKFMYEHSNETKEECIQTLAKNWSEIKDGVVLVAVCMWAKSRPGLVDNIKELEKKVTGLALSETEKLQVSFAFPQFLPFDPILQQNVEIELWRIDFYFLWLLAQGNCDETFFKYMLESRYVDCLRLREIVQMIDHLKPEGKYQGSVLRNMQQRRQNLLNNLLMLDKITIYKYQQTPCRRPFKAFTMPELLLRPLPKYINTTQSQLLMLLQYLISSQQKLTYEQSLQLISEMIEYNHPGKLYFFMQLYLVCEETLGELLQEFSRVKIPIVAVLLVSHGEMVREVWAKMWTREEATGIRVMRVFGITLKVRPLTHQEIVKKAEETASKQVQKKKLTDLEEFLNKLQITIDGDEEQFAIKVPSYKQIIARLIQTIDKK